MSWRKESTDWICYQPRRRCSGNLTEYRPFLFFFASEWWSERWLETTYMLLLPLSPTQGPGQTAMLFCWSKLEIMTLIDFRRTQYRWRCDQFFQRIGQTRYRSRECDENLDCLLVYLLPMASARLSPMYYTYRMASFISAVSSRNWNV